MTTIRISHNENVSEFSDRLTLLVSGAKPVLEDKYGLESTTNMKQPITDYVLESLTKDPPDAVARLIEARNSKTIEGAFKYALEFEAHHQYLKPDHNAYHCSRYYQPNDYHSAILLT